MAGDGPTEMIIFGGFLVVAGLLCGAVAIVGTRRSLRIQRSGRRALATVVDKRTEPRSVGGGDSMEMDLRFYVALRWTERDGAQREAEQPVSERQYNALRPGRTAAIILPPPDEWASEDEPRFELPGKSASRRYRIGHWVAAAIALAVGLPMLAWGIAELARL